MRSKLAYFIILTAHHAVMSYEIIAGKIISCNLIVKVI